MPPGCRQSAAEGASLARYGVRAVDRCIDTQGLMAKPCTPQLIAQRVQFFKHQSRNVSLSLGDIRGVFSFAKENTPLCAADSDKQTDPVRQYGDDAARDGDAEEDDRHGTLQAHIEHGGDERARPRAGARQRNGDKQQ